jgi:peroxiredoxin
MTGARKLQIAAAFTLGVVLPCAVTFWFFKEAGVADKQSILGEDAPDFDATTFSGDVHKLSDHDGERLALLFVNFDCPACVEQLSYLDRLNREISSSDFGALAISESSYERTCAFVDDFTLSFPLVIDYGSMTEDYRAEGGPTLVLVDEKRIVRFHKSGQMQLSAMRRLIRDFALEGKIPLEAFVDTEGDEQTRPAVGEQ